MDTIQRSELLYQRLADELMASIRHGILKPGERLPSIRQIAKQRELSISTVTLALRTLENKGLVEAKPQSGYFVRKQSILTPSAPVTAHIPPSNFMGVNAVVAKVRESCQNPPMEPLTSANPSPELYPTDKLMKILARQARNARPECSANGRLRGSRTLRRQIARRYLDLGFSATEDDILLAHGCMEGLNLALRAVAKPGDTIAVESPTYFVMLQLIETLGMKALEIPTDPHHGISLEALELATRDHAVQALFIVPNASNPLGVTLSPERKRQLVELMAARQVPIIEDDVFGDLHFSGPRPLPLRAYDQDGNVILVSSFSKTVSPGFSDGWIMPGRYRPQIEQLKLLNSGVMPNVLQHTLAEFLETGGYEHHLRQLRRSLAQQVADMSELVLRHFPSGTRISQPAGGCVLWVELPDELDTLSLHERAAREHISFAPGPIFSPTGRYQHCLRLSCGFPVTTGTEQMLARLSQLITR
ncbi:DNA-binding transcriptional MocR family regulator [Chitinivorax tropicus]|uniref:DNA-binding transcriptional MocR family regulator n=1 Tax=Chitinivorax tropicus TaxID=714531 RepID=A0A840MFK9_9PROT|nr:PLP-dependent aminotransferase family protein [Chitinivorax tropicus]MBB5017190.1 DNA-binding transcriptional MocR family regulator [Chitinivorax tropicus]